MSLLNTSAAAAVLAGAAALGAPESASAGGFSLSIGPQYGVGYGGFHGGYGGFNNVGHVGHGHYGRGFDNYGYGGGYGRYGRFNNVGYGGYRGGYGGRYGGFGGTSVYHDTSHVDVINGRRVFHRSGHFDHYGPGHFGGH